MKKQRDSTGSCVVELSGMPEPPSAVTGTLVGFAPSGVPLIDVSGTQLCARSCVPLHAYDTGKDVAVLFDAGHPESPIVLGVIQPAAGVEVMDVVLDGKHLALSAHESITLRCGEAAITLTRDGKIVIRGAHVVSHASGVNRIRGGSVELN